MTLGGTNTAAQPGRLSGSQRTRWERVARMRVRWARRVADERFDAAVLRAEELVNELIERVRERVQPSAPAPQQHGHPSPEEWSAWAKEELPAEDAEVFQVPEHTESR